MKGCDVELQAGDMMCVRHALLIPLPLVKTLARLYNRGRVREGYEEARASAIEQVETRLHRYQRGGG